MMNHCTRGCLPGRALSNITTSVPAKANLLLLIGCAAVLNGPSGRALTLCRVERTVFPDEGVPNVQAS